MSNQYGYPPDGMQGYGQPHTGYTTPQVPFAQGTDQEYRQTPGQGSFTPYSGMAYAQQSSPYSVPMQQGNSGSYIPQTPYSPGYTSPGYQPAAGYPPQNGYQQPNGYPPQKGYPQQSGYAPQNSYQPQAGYQMPSAGYPQQGGYPPPYEYQPPQGSYNAGYNPYGQMGKTPPQKQAQSNFSSSIPLNGGGYVPQRVPVRKRDFELKNWHLIAAGAVLIALFVAAVLILKSTPLKILLMLLAAGSAGFLWVKNLTAENKRLTYTILALALCLLTAVSFLLNQPGDVTKKRNDSGQNSTEAQNGSYNSDVQEIPMNNGTGGAEETPVPETADSALMERLVTFFTYWSQNRQDEMLTLCAPSWVSKQENARISLFTLLANRTPTECTPESITGTDADDSRRVTLTAKIDRHNDKKVEKYRFTILMLKESNEWYVDPQSLLSNENVETPDPNVTPTPAPTETPAVYSNTVLYYNPSGGQYYHADPNCKIVGTKYVPLAGQFTYGEINNEPYKNLQPCNVCGAPLRP